MRKVVTPSFGSLSQLAVVEEPDLVPATGQIVIDVQAAGVNFVDALIVEGRYQMKPPMPYTPGSEVAGVIAAVGDGVEGLAVGDRVLALPSSGGYASQVAVPSPAVLPIPDNLSAAQAAGLVQSYATMLYALTRRTTVIDGEWFAVLGAGGGIGLAAVDLATALGAHVVACASTTEKVALARSLGAEATITYDDEDFDLKTAIRAMTDGGADAVVDPIGGPKAEAALRSVRWGGRYLVLGFAAGEIPRIPLNRVLLNSRTVIGVEWGAWAMRDPAGNRALLGELLDLVGAGRIHPVEPVARPLDEAASVLADLQARRVTGKAVLRP